MFTRCKNNKFCLDSVGKRCIVTSGEFFIGAKGVLQKGREIIAAFLFFSKLKQSHSLPQAIEHTATCIF